MPEKGYITMRKAPTIPNPAPMGNPYYEELMDFFLDRVICDTCEGTGIFFKRPNPKEETSVNVRYKGIEAFEKISDSVKRNDLIRKVLEYHVWGKRYCKDCRGYGHLSRKRLASLGKS